MGLLGRLGFLIEWEGYVRFGGQPIIALAPLFSIYLAGIQKIVGVSGGALVLALILLAALTSSAWCYLFSSLSNRETTSPYQLLLFPIYVSMFVSFYYRNLLSETLFLSLLAFLFIVIAQIALQKGQKGQVFRQIFSLNVILALLLFSRNSALLFVPGVVIALFLTLDHLNQVSRVFLSFLTAFFPLASWSG